MKPRVLARRTPLHASLHPHRRSRQPRTRAIPAAPRPPIRLSGHGWTRPRILSTTSGPSARSWATRVSWVWVRVSTTSTSSRSYGFACCVLWSSGAASPRSRWRRGSQRPIVSIPGCSARARIRLTSTGASPSRATATTPRPGLSFAGFTTTMPGFRPGKRVRFYGIDIPHGGGAISPALDEAWRYLDRVDTSLAAASRARLSGIADRFGIGRPTTAKARYDSLDAGKPKGAERRTPGSSRSDGAAAGRLRAGLIVS